MYIRKYDFKSGTRISSSQVDEELNQLIAAANNLEANKVPYSGATSDINLNNKSISNIKSLLGNVDTPDCSQVSATRTLTIGMSSSGVDYKVFFDVENVDVQSEFASSVFKPKQSGYYLITIYAAFNAVVSGNTYVKLYKGGAYATTIGGVTNQQIISVSRLVYLTAGQPYDFYVAQNSGSSQTVTSFNLDLVKLT